MRNLTCLVLVAAGLTACGDDTATSISDATNATSATAPNATTTAATTTTADTDPAPTSGTTADATTATTDAAPTTAPEPTTTGPDVTGEPGESSSSGGPAVCVGEMQTLVLDRPNVVLALDVSATMDNDVYDHDADPNTAPVTYWSSVHAAIDATLPAYEKWIDFGVKLYPGAAANNDYSMKACTLPATMDLEIGSVEHGQILGAMPEKASTSLQGAWPVAAALSVAYDRLNAQDPDEEGVIALILRGLPACSADAQDDMSLFEVYDDNAPAVAAAALADGVKTHVIALNASDQSTGQAMDAIPNNVVPSQKFAELAVAGGTGPFVNAKTEAQIADALDAVLAALPEVDCALPLASPLAFADQAVVRLDGEDLPRVEDCAAEDGWRYVEDAPPFTAIELCGAACEQLFEVGSFDVVDCADAPG